MAKDNAILQQCYLLVSRQRLSCSRYFIFISNLTSWERTADQDLKTINIVIKPVDEDNAVVVIKKSPTSRSPSVKLKTAVFIPIQSQTPLKSLRENQN